MFLIYCRESILANKLLLIRHIKWNSTGFPLLYNEQVIFYTTLQQICRNCCLVVILWMQYFYFTMFHRQQVVQMLPQNNLHFWNIAHLATMYFNLLNVLTATYEAQLVKHNINDITYQVSNHIIYLLPLGHPVSWSFDIL